MSPERQWSSPAKRLRLFWIFIILAVPLMVVMVAYAYGFRIDPNSNKILQTSALAIETTPSNAVVVLNNQPAANATPYISTLLPGQYTVVVQKSGYKPWQKQLLFEERKSVIFPDVLLFLDTSPVARDTTPNDPPAEYTSLIAVDDEIKELYRNNNWLRDTALRIIDGPWDVVVDTSTRTSYLVENLQDFAPDISFPAVVIDAEWTRDTVAVLATESELLVFHPSQKQSDVVHRQSQRILDVEWHVDGGYIFFSDDNGIYALELDDRDHRQLWQLSTLPSPTQLQLNARGDRISFISDRQWYDLQLYD